MELEEEFSELQRLFAQTDMITAPSTRSNGRFMEILLIKRLNMKIKIYQEVGHHMPHIHIDYGRQHHVASYAIATGDRLEGNLAKRYDSDVKGWLEQNRDKLLEIWKALQAGHETKELVANLAGNV